jgi:post-segregation antitoxin (ccd killing protein)
MGLIRASVTIPEDIYNTAKKLSDNFSFLVAEALKEYFRKASVKNAKKSFGSWKGREDEDSVSIVNKMRAKDRRYASRAD